MKVKLEMFKERAVDIYIDNIIKNVPNIKENDIEMIKVAFRTGMNVGAVQHLSEEIQELALFSLSE